jgi:type VI secretion system protein VasG
VRTGHLMVGIAEDPVCATRCSRISREFDKVKLDALTEQFSAIVGRLAGSGMRASDGSQVGGGAAPGEASEAMAPGRRWASKRPYNAIRWI